MAYVDNSNIPIGSGTNIYSILAGNFYLGVSASYNGIPYVAEHLIYTGYHTPFQRATIFQYIKNRYNISAIT